MSTFESIYLMLTFATFIIALLAYIDIHRQAKIKNTYPDTLASAG